MSAEAAAAHQIKTYGSTNNEPEGAPIYPVDRLLYLRHPIRLIREGACDPLAKFKFILPAIILSNFLPRICEQIELEWEKALWLREARRRVYMSTRIEILSHSVLLRKVAVPIRHAFFNDKGLRQK